MRSQGWAQQLLLVSVSLTLGQSVTISLSELRHVLAVPLCRYDCYRRRRRGRPSGSAYFREKNLGELILGYAGLGAGGAQGTSARFYGAEPDSKAQQHPGERPQAQQPSTTNHTGPGSAAPSSIGAPVAAPGSSGAPGAAPSPSGAPGAPPRGGRVSGLTASINQAEQVERLRVCRLPAGPCGDGPREALDALPGAPRRHTRTLQYCNLQEYCVVCCTYLSCTVVVVHCAGRRSPMDRDWNALLGPDDGAVA